MCFRNFYKYVICVAHRAKITRYLLKHQGTQHKRTSTKRNKFHHFIFNQDDMVNQFILVSGCYALSMMRFIGDQN